MCLPGTIPSEAVAELPNGLELIGVHGLRVVTPIGSLWRTCHTFPLMALERRCRDHPGLEAPEVFLFFQFVVAPKFALRFKASMNRTPV